MKDFFNFKGMLNEDFDNRCDKLVELLKKELDSLKG